MRGRKFKATQPGWDIAAHWSRWSVKIFWMFFFPLLVRDQTASEWSQKTCFESKKKGMTNGNETEKCTVSAFCVLRWGGSARSETKISLRERGGVWAMLVIGWMTSTAIKKKWWEKKNHILKNEMWIEPSTIETHFDSLPQSFTKCNFLFKLIRQIFSLKSSTNSFVIFSIFNFNEESQSPRLPLFFFAPIALARWHCALASWRFDHFFELSMGIWFDEMQIDSLGSSDSNVL